MIATNNSQQDRQGRSAGVGARFLRYALPVFAVYLAVFMAHRMGYLAADSESFSFLAFVVFCAAQIIIMRLTGLLDLIRKPGNFDAR